MEPMDAETEDATFAPPMPWRVRLRHELRRSRPLLSVDEPADDGRYLAVDLTRALVPRRPVAPSGRCGGRCACDAALVLRACFLAAALHVTYVDFAVYYPIENWKYYMIYLTHWGHTLNVSYLACSLCCRLFLRRALGRWKEALVPGEDGQLTAVPATHLKPPFLARLTWSLYALAAPLAISIALLYWTALVPIAGGIPTNGPSLYHVHFGWFVKKYGGWGGPDRGDILDIRASTYVSVMEHGVLGLLVLLDGAKLGCIPVRAKQVAVLMALCIAYLTWSGIHCLLGIGVGDWEGPIWETDDDGSDDDAIYPVLNWCGGEEGIKLASYVSLFAVLVLAPMAFGAVWFFGLAAPKEKGLCCRRWKFDGSCRPVYIVAPAEEAFRYKEYTGEVSLV